MLILTPLVGFLMGKADNRLLIGSGMVITAVSALMMGNFDLDMSSDAYFWPNFLQGMGIALTSVPLMTMAVSTVSNEEMGNATGLFALARNLAGSIGIAVAIAMVSRGALQHQAYLVSHLTPYDLPYQTAVQMGQAALTPKMGAAQAESGALGTIYQSLLQHSNMLAFADEFRWLALVCALSVPLVLVFKKAQGRKDVMMH